MKKICKMCKTKKVGLCVKCNKNKRSNEPSRCGLCEECFKKEENVDLKVCLALESLIKVVNYEMTDEEYENIRDNIFGADLKELEDLEAQKITMAQFLKYEEDKRTGNASTEVADDLLDDLDEWLTDINECTEDCKLTENDTNK